MNKAIETFELTKQYPQTTNFRSLFTKSDDNSIAVNQTNLTVHEGEVFGLLGPNGAGKTTLIKMLACLISPTSGHATVNGFHLHEERSIKSSIGLVTSDERSFYWRLTGRQNLIFFANLHGLPQNQIERSVAQVISSLELENIADKRFLTYSTGMRQRLAIARSLINNPGILFLDEPTKGLDPGSKKLIHEIIFNRLRTKTNLTIFLTTHNLEEAQKLCDRISIMNLGNILAVGDLASLGQMVNIKGHYQFLVEGLTNKSIQTLTDAIPQIQVSKGTSHNDNFITLPEPDSTEILNTAIDSIRNSSSAIKSVDHKKPTLDSIFTQLVERDSDITNQKEIQPLQLSSDINGINTSISNKSVSKIEKKSIKERIFSLWSIFTAFLKRDLISEASYRFSFFLQFFGIFFSVGVFYFLSELLGDSVSPHLSQYGGDYFSFVLIGIAFVGYFGVGLTSFSSRLRQSQTTGTLEAMLTTPTNVSIIILASSLWDYLLTTLKVVVYLCIGVLFLGVNLRNSNYLAAILILLLTITSFSSLGIIAASFIMVLKRGNPITWAFSAVSSLLGGVYYPTTILPDWLRWVSKLLPITYALDAMRLALLQGASLRLLLPDIFALLIFTVILLPLSLFSFRYAVNRAKIDGSLTQY